jgi:phosphosulfolactate synthase
MSRDIELTRAYQSVALGSRPEKPRSSGLTIAVEFGVGPRTQEDFLSVAAHTLDYVKQVVSIAGIMPRVVLEEKIEIYRKHGIKPFPGGMFLEYAHARGLVDEYLKETRAVGYGVLEVSENARSIDRAARTEIIQKSLDMGFEVLGEVGSKHVKSTPEDLTADVNELMSLGCSRVLIEAAELMVDGAVDETLIRMLEDETNINDCVFELPGPWIPNIHHHDVVSMEMWLLKRFGPEVNIANDGWGNSLYLEACRRGVGANLFE